MLIEDAALRRVLRCQLGDAVACVVVRVRLARSLRRLLRRGPGLLRFFLRGSGYAEGTLFPWTMSDFSLMDAIECGIVKLPRVPVADNIPGGEMPKFRNLWENVRARMPKKGTARLRRTTVISPCRSGS